MNSQIVEIEQALLGHLNNFQMEQLHRVLIHVLDAPAAQTDDVERNFLPVYIAAKRVEGCSDKTLRYYESTIINALNSINKPVRQITTDDLRLYLDTYQQRNNAGKVTIDNVRRVLSSFFSWLEDEDYILKSPVRRIHKVKTGKTVKETYTDEALEIMRLAKRWEPRGFSTGSFEHFSSSSWCEAQSHGSGRGQALPLGSLVV